MKSMSSMRTSTLQAVCAPPSVERRARLELPLQADDLARGMASACVAPVVKLAQGTVIVCGAVVSVTLGDAGKP